MVDMLNLIQLVIVDAKNLIFYNFLLKNVKFYIQRDYGYYLYLNETSIIQHGKINIIKQTIEFSYYKQYKLHNNINPCNIDSIKIQSLNRQVGYQKNINLLY